MANAKVRLQVSLLPLFVAYKPIENNLKLLQAR